MESGFLDIERAAAWSSVSRRTMERWIQRGLRVYQAGPRAKVLIRCRDIEDFLTKRQAPKPALDALVDATMKELRVRRP
jgi:predicted site-specific integrase-resolvase